MRNYPNPFNIILILIIILMISLPVQAGILDSIKNWAGGTAIAFILTGLLAIGVIAKWTNWICVVLTSVGFLLVSIGSAFRDKKITKEELQEMKAKLSEVRTALKARPK